MSVITQTGPLTNNFNFGDATARTRLIQTVTPAAAITVTKVVCYISKDSTPTDDISCNIYAVDGSSHPTGSALASSTNTISGSTLIAGVALRCQFDFAGLALSSGVKYAVVFLRSGAVGGSFYRIWRTDDADYAGGGQSDWDGSTTYTDRTTDLAVELYAVGETVIGRLPVTITGISTAVAPVGPFKITNGLILETTATISTEQEAGTTNVYRHGQTFTPASNVAVTSVAFNQKIRFGTITDNWYVEIYAVDASHYATGSVLGTSNNVAGATFTSTSTWISYTFSTPVNLTGGVEYIALISRTGAASGTNNLAVNGANTDVYAGGMKSYVNSTGTWTASSSQDNALRVYGAEAYYFFARDGTTATTLRAYKSTAPDTSWASVATKTGFDTAVLGLSGYQVGNIFHLTVSDGSLATGIINHKYQTFDALTDSFITAETIASAATSGQTGTGQPNASLVVRSTGEVVAFFNGVQSSTMGTSYARVYYSRRTGVNTWSAGVQVDANTAFDNITPEVLLGAADRLHFFWGMVGSNSLNQRHLTAANVLGTAGSNSSVGSGTSARFDSVSYVSGANQRIVVAKYSTINTRIHNIAINSADNPAVTVTCYLPENSTTYQGQSIFVGNDGTDAWALFRQNAASDLYAAKSTDGGATWGTPALAFSGTVANDAVALSRDGNIYQRGSSFVIPYIVNDNGTLQYNEHVVRYLTQADAWDLNNSSVGYTLSNGDKTATYTLGSFSSVRSTTGRMNGTAGKYYAEFLAGGTFTLMSLGLVPASAGIATSSTVAIDVYNGDGSITTDTNVGSVGSGYAAGDTICMAWDAGTETIWFRKNGGNWNNSGTADPATATGGISIASFTTAQNHYLWGQAAESGATLTCRTEVADFVYQGPSGFTSWMGEIIPTPDAWNVNDKNSIVALSNSDKTATSTSTSIGPVRSTKTYPASGTAKLYAEIVIGTAGGTNNYGGIHDTTTLITNSFYGTSTKSLGYSGNSTGFMLLDGNVVASGMGGLANNDVVCIAWDTVNQTGWLRKNGGNWNNDGSANPATNTNGFSTSTFTGSIALAGYINNQNNTSTIRTEVAEFTVANKPSGFTSWMGETMGPANFNLVAGTGAITVAGQAVILRYARLPMPAAKGAVTVAGQAVILRRGYNMTAATGAVAISGKAVNLLRSRVMTAATGAIAISGKLVTLARSRTMAAATRAVTVAGQAVVLRVGRKLIAGTGAVAISGKLTGLQHGRKLAAGTGAVVIAGQAVELTEGGGTVHYTMPADTGAVTVAGQSVNLFRTRAMLAATGAVALAGQPVGLQYGRKLTAATGAITVAGQPVNLLRTRVMPAAKGAVAIAGQPVGLRAARILTAGTGAVAVAGQPVVLRTGRNLVAATGAVTVAGQPVNLLRSRVMPAATGAVAIAGQAVNLRYSADQNTNMLAATGVVTVAGQAVALRATRKMVAAKGAVTVAGQPVVLRTGRNLIAAKGAVTVAGQPVVLRVGRKLAAGTGAVTVAGQPVTFRYTRVMPAGTGAVAISGKAATLIFVDNKIMGAATGSILISGKSATLRHAHRLVAGTGAVTVTGTAVALRAARRMTAALRNVVIAGQPVNLTVVLAGIYPELFVNANTFYTHVLSGSYTLTPARYDDPDTFYTHAVTSSYALSPALYVNPNTFYSHVVTIFQGVFPALFVNTNTFYTHYISFDQFLEPQLYIDSDVFPQAHVEAFYGDTESVFVRYENRRMNVAADRRMMNVSAEDRSMEARYAGRVMDVESRRRAG